MWREVQIYCSLPSFNEASISFPLRFRGILVPSWWVLTWIACLSDFCTRSQYHRFDKRCLSSVKTCPQTVCLCVSVSVCARACVCYREREGQRDLEEAGSVCLDSSCWNRKTKLMFFTCLQGELSTIYMRGRAHTHLDFKHL